LGEMYDLGLGVEINREQAVYWHKKAAEQRHEQAQSRLENTTKPQPPQQHTQQKQAQPDSLQTQEEQEELHSMPVVPDFPKEPVLRSVFLWLSVITAIIIINNFSVGRALDLLFFLWSIAGSITALIITVKAIIEVAGWSEYRRATLRLIEIEKKRLSDIAERAEQRVCIVCEKTVSDYTNEEWGKLDNKCKSCYRACYNSPEQKRYREKRARREQQFRKEFAKRRKRINSRCQFCGLKFSRDDTRCGFCRRKRGRESFKVDFIELVLGVDLDK